MNYLLALIIKSVCGSYLFFEKVNPDLESDL